MLLQLVAFPFTTIVKIACLASSLTFEFDCFVYCIKTHILATNSQVAMASLLRIKELSKLD